ncbi:hypothetical protein ABT324_28505 [Saccharopolyspora sp. NPDC000359]|uniref:hypothetical protein n=1 Tax=Saccharopolyspora sp. NPDC000359 TaxID=3154251 RepID=UPI00331A39E9
MPVLLHVEVLGPGVVTSPPERVCQASAPIVVEHCDRHVRPDGSVLVDRTTALASGEGAPNREAQHFRADGSVVSVTTSFGATPQDPTASGQDAPPLDSAEITALTTDPQLPLSR